MANNRSCSMISSCVEILVSFWPWLFELGTEIEKNVFRTLWQLTLPNLTEKFSSNYLLLFFFLSINKLPPKWRSCQWRHSSFFLYGYNYNNLFYSHAKNSVLLTLYTFCVNPSFRFAYRSLIPLLNWCRKIMCYLQVFFSVKIFFLFHYCNRCSHLFRLFDL